jgi:hypothetical protein
MYLKVNNGVVEKYPYTINDLKKDNPQTSFPQNISNTLLEEWGMFPVLSTNKPDVDFTKKVIEKTPNLVNGSWYQDWSVIDLTQAEIDDIKTQKNLEAKSNRAEAYRNESDPIFFKWQRGESTQQEWIDKVNEIKARYPEV